DKLVDNLSKADYDIVTPARGFKILAEVLAFGLHVTDRAAHLKLSRQEDSATFDLPDNGASFPTLRYLGAQIREVMDERDEHWVMDQVMDIEMPEVLGTLKKTLDGLFSPAGAAPSPRRVSGD